MNNTFLSYLFTKGYLVSDKGSDSFAVLFTLANKFGIKITEGASLASPELIELCADELGEYVPAPFYRGFPDSVKALTKDQLLFDQLYHYFESYVLGNLDEAGHSIFEKDFERSAFREDTEPRKMAIIDTKRANELIREYADEMLKGSRPLNTLQYSVVKELIQSYGYKPKECVCKNTAVELIADLGKSELAKFLALSDVIKLVEEINHKKYSSDDIKKLKFSSKDRKIVSSVLDIIFESGLVNTRVCFEKKKLWVGLLHHIHYKPKCERSTEFLNLIRAKGNISAYSDFERAINAGDIRGAVLSLKSGKGTGALLRNLNYILSRCESHEDVSFVLDNLDTDNAIVLIQLLLSYGSYKASGPRTFVFPKHNRIMKHTETEQEQQSRRSSLSPVAVELLSSEIEKKLRALLRARLGKVYISPKMKGIAIPIQESTSQAGLGVLPKGSRLPINDGKKIRAFTYWEGVDDIDLSFIGLADNGEEVEFSWRTMAEKNGGGILFSGDQTSGMNGGSEYFDIDIELFKKKHPQIKYLVFCNNVYSSLTFSQCLCRAGYMTRDTKDSGKVFEPKAVKSSFVINCDSTFAYLFALDVEKREFIWLNAANGSNYHIAGQESVKFLERYFEVSSVIDLYTLFEMLAAEVVSDPKEAELIICDEELDFSTEAKIIRSCDFEKINSYLG